MVISVQVDPGGGNKLSLVGSGEDWGIAAASASAAVYSWSISNCFAISSKDTQHTLSQEEEPTNKSEE